MQLPMRTAFMRNLTILLTGCLAVILAGCAARTSLEPAGRGVWKANAGFGGPMVYAFDTYVPIPYLAAGASYGADDRLDVNGTLHLLSLAYGIVGLEPGVTWYPVLNSGAVPTIGISPRILMFASIRGDVEERFRFYPVVSASGAWRVGDGLLYTGFDLTLPLSRPDYDDDAATAILSPLLGYRWSIGETMGLYTELKWHGANVRTNQLAAEYVHPFGNGAIAPFIAVDWKW